MSLQSATGRWLRYAKEQTLSVHDLNETIDIRFTTPSLEPTPTTPAIKELPVQAHQAAHYNAPDTDAPAADEPAEEENGATLAELRAEAEALNLPTYGTKAQLAERIANAENMGEDNTPL